MTCHLTQGQCGPGQVLHRGEPRPHCQELSTDTSPRAQSPTSFCPQHPYICPSPTLTVRVPVDGHHGPLQLGRCGTLVSLLKGLVARALTTAPQPHEPVGRVQRHCSPYGPPCAGRRRDPPTPHPTHPACLGPGFTGNRRALLPLRLCVSRKGEETVRTDTGCARPPLGAGRLPGRPENRPRRVHT